MPTTCRFAQAAHEPLVTPVHVLASWRHSAISLSVLGVGRGGEEWSDGAPHRQSPAAFSAIRCLRARCIFIGVYRRASAVPTLAADRSERPPPEMAMGKPWRIRSLSRPFETADERR